MCVCVCVKEREDVTFVLLLSLVLQTPTKNDEEVPDVILFLDSIVTSRFFPRSDLKNAQKDK